MSNLLTKKTQNRNKREYHFRILIVSIILLSALVVCGAVFLVPSFILSSAKEQAVLVEQDSFHSSFDLSGDESIEGIVNDLALKIEILDSLPDVFVYENIRKGVLESMVDGIFLNSLSYQSSDGNEFFVTIRGVARNRDILRSFASQLEDSGVFREVVIPIEDLVKRTDLDFSLTLFVN